MKVNDNIESSKINSNNEALDNKVLKKRNINNSETYCQDYDIVNFMRKNPPKLPSIYDHNYDLQNSNKKSKKETYGEINRGKIPVIFFGHLMIEKEKRFIKSSITHRNKKKIVDYYILYTLIYFFVFNCCP